MRRHTRLGGKRSQSGDGGPRKYPNPPTFSRDFKPGPARPFATAVSPRNPQGYVALISDPGWLAPRENFRPVSLARSLLPVDGRIRTVGRTPRLVFDERTSARRPVQPREVAGCPRSQVSHEPRGQAPARCDGQGSTMAAVMGTPGGRDSWFFSGTMASMRPVRSSGFDPRLVASAGRDRRPGPRSNDPNQPGQPGHRGGGIA